MEPPDPIPTAAPPSVPVKPVLIELPGEDPASLLAEVRAAIFANISDQKAQRDIIARLFELQHNGRRPDRRFPAQLDRLLAIRDLRRAAERGDELSRLVNRRLLLASLGQTTALGYRAALDVISGLGEIASRFRGSGSEKYSREVLKQASKLLHRVSGADCSVALNWDHRVSRPMTLTTEGLHYREACSGVLWHNGRERKRFLEDAAPTVQEEDPARLFESEGAWGFAAREHIRHAASLLIRGADVHVLIFLGWRNEVSPATHRERVRDLELAVRYASGWLHERHFSLERPFDPLDLRRQLLPLLEALNHFAGPGEASAGDLGPTQIVELEKAIQGILGGRTRGDRGGSLEMMHKPGYHVFDARDNTIEYHLDRKASIKRKVEADPADGLAMGNQNTRPGLSAQALLAHSTLYLPDVQGAMHGHPETNRHLGSIRLADHAGVRSEVCVPVFYTREEPAEGAGQAAADPPPTAVRLGVINVECAETDGFGAIDILRLELCRNLLAVLHRTAFSPDAKEAREFFRAKLRSKETEAAAIPGGIDQLLRMYTGWLRGHTGCDIAYVLVFDPQRRAFVPSAVEASDEVLAIGLGGERIPADSPMTRRAVAQSFASRLMPLRRGRSWDVFSSGVPEQEWDVSEASRPVADFARDHFRTILAEPFSFHERAAPDGVTWMGWLRNRPSGSSPHGWTDHLSERRIPASKRVLVRRVTQLVCALAAFYRLEGVRQA